MLPMIDVHTRYITFPVINPLNTVRCSQILNNDYGILETDIYWQASGVSENQQLILELIF